MLRTVRPWQHLVVGLSILVMALLVGFGFLGAGDEALLRPEHFDAKQVTVWPDGDDGVRIREVVDIDFGLTERHGYQRRIPNDFGVPVDVEASSPNANADVNVVELDSETRIRVGDPVETLTNRHRYVLEYTLPNANTSSGTLLLDIIGDEETFETQRFEVIITGFEFDGTECDTGTLDAIGGCDLVTDESGNQIVVFEPLAPGELITVGGRIVSITDPIIPPIPDPVPPIPGGFRPLGLLMIPLGLAAALTVFLIGRSTGSNTVVAGGAADAAFGSLQPPGSANSPAGVPTSRVPDSRLAEMATIEFVPPAGLEPWQAAVVLRESVDDETVSAWFSEMIAVDAVSVTDADGTVTLSPGPNAGRLSALDQGHLQQLFADRDQVALGSYDKEFTATWASILDEQRTFARTSGWWSRGGPSGRMTTPTKFVVALVAVLAIAVGCAALVVLLQSTALWRVIMSPAVAVIAGFLVPLLVAAFAYSAMFASRTATGSALALRSESFRRFLASSEGSHVEWAWKQGLVREYSAWAVALGAAEAWSTAIEDSKIPDPSAAMGGPLLVYSAGSSFRSSHTAPSSSGGGGVGGGGGGGGGGSSGSW